MKIKNLKKNKNFVVYLLNILRTHFDHNQRNSKRNEVGKTDEVTNTYINVVVYVIV